MQQRPPHRRVRLFPGAALLFLLLILPLQLHASEKRPLSIATTFPEELAQVIGRAFEQRHPDIAVTFSYRATTALIEHLTANEGAGADLVWMSSPAAIRELMKSGLLADDPADCVFAYSRFGIMWREDLLAARGIPPPAAWSDLALPRYRGEIGISSPSRSGTMGIWVEAVLQSEGWERGWAQLQQIGGNLATVTARSIGVREGLLHGRFAIGVGVDFLARTTASGGTPVRFLASPGGMLLPAGACSLRRAEHPETAGQFKAFLHSPEGQALLSHPLTQRISLEEGRRLLAAGAPGARIFDTAMAERRSGLVAVMFDQLITYRQADLRSFWTAYHETAALAAASGVDAGGPPHGEAADRLRRARIIAGAVGVPDFMTEDAAFTTLFKTAPGPASDLRGMRRRLQEDWIEDSRSRLRDAGAQVSAARASLGRPASASSAMEQ